ncbi:hypothetical protein HOE31_00780 [bacterium]|nr:hypothetical protein [bacterium]MBT4495147.1 hypothetical protein [bacterium]MBT6336066.1 hypothetical protein [bacterium]MBT7337060.1 hypothetical protein [bacterium]
MNYGWDIEKYRYIVISIYSYICNHEKVIKHTCVSITVSDEKEDKSITVNFDREMLIQNFIEKKGDMSQPDYFPSQYADEESDMKLDNHRKGQFQLKNNNKIEIQAINVKPGTNRILIAVVNFNEFMDALDNLRSI